MYLWSATVFHLMQVQDDIVDEEIGQFTGPDPLQTLHTYYTSQWVPTVDYSESWCTLWKLACEFHLSALVYQALLPSVPFSVLSMHWH